MVENGPSPPAPDHWLSVIALLLLLTGGYVVFGQVGGFKFVQFDDPALVTGNPYVNRGLTGDSVVWAFTFQESEGRPVEPLAREIWAPLAFLSHALDFQCFGEDPGRHHLVNLGLHLGSAALVFMLFYVLSDHPVVALLVAAVVCFHPMRVESVAWISERKGLLSGFFVLGALNFYALGVKKPGLADRGWLKAGTILAFILACLAKPTAIVTPLLMGVIDGWFSSRENVDLSNWRYWWDQVRVKWAYWAVSLLIGGVTVTLNAIHGHADGPGGDPGLRARLVRIPVTILFYLERTLWPSGLYPIYPAYPHSLVWGTILGIAVVVGMSILAWRRRRSAPEWLFGWLWFLVCLLPVMGFVHVGRSFTSDRYTYLAHAGLAFAMVQSLTTLMEKRRNLSPSILGLLIGLVFLIGLGSRQLAGIWRDSGRLFKRGILVQPDSASNWNNLGAWQTMSGDFEGGIGALRKAVELGSEPEAFYNLANALRYQGDDLAGAVALYRDCLRRDPAHARAMRDLGLVLTDPAAGILYDPIEGCPWLEKAGEWFLREGQGAEVDAIRKRLLAIYAETGEAAGTARVKAWPSAGQQGVSAGPSR